jgi:hypothetical protein
MKKKQKSITEESASKENVSQVLSKLKKNLEFTM